MGNATSSRPGLFHRKRLLAVSAVVGVLAISAVVATLVLLPSLNRPVHASGVGGGGCYPTSGPVGTFKGQTASASFEATTACTVTDIFVFVNANFSRSGGATQTSSFLNLSTEMYNTCTGSYSEGVGQDYNPTVQSSSGALTAQGSADVQTYNSSDGTTSTTTYTVNLTWKGFGKPSRQVDSSHFQSPGFITQTHFTGTSQSALVTGTLSDGTTNFAGSSTNFGESLSADSGTFVIIQN
jgi:hypothetical protein